MEREDAVKKTLGLITIGILFLLLSHPVSASPLKLRVGVVADCPPYQYCDADGSCKGLNVDVMNIIAKQQGFFVEYVVYESESECKKAMADGSIDMILGVYYSSREDSAWLSSDISVGTMCLVAKKDTAELMRNGSDPSDFITVYEYGTATASLLSNLNARKILAVGNQQNILETERRGDAQIMVGIKESLLFQMRENGYSDEYHVINNSLSTISYAIQVKENDWMLLRVINRGITSLRASSEYEALYDQWIVSEEQGFLQKYSRQILIAFIIACLLAAIYMVVSLNVRNMLKRQVELRTAELSKVSKELERQLAQLEEESDFRNRIIQNSKQGMILFDRDYQIILINPTAVQLTNTKAGTGDDVRNVAVYREILRQCGDEIFTRPDDEWPNSIALSSETETSGSRERHYRYRVQSIVKNGTVVGVLLAVEDITIEEERKQQLFEAEKSESLNRMVAGLAHEIKNPLMAIRTFAAVGAEGDMDPQFIEDFCMYVPSELDRINQLIESMVNYAAPPKGEKTRFNVKDVIEECGFFANSLIDSQCMVLHIESGKDCILFGNRNQIKQVIINLLANSVDSMRDKWSRGYGKTMQLHLCVKEYPQETEIFVRDEGCGMSAEAIKHCREPFFTTKKRGSGLGLALCEQYVRDNHGRMYLESQEGDHTTIRLVFRGEMNESESADY